MKIILALLFAFSFTANAYITPVYLNANQLQGTNVSATAPTDGQVLKYVLADLAWEPATGGGGSGVDTVGTFGSSPTANAATITGTSIFFQPADGTHPGSITSGTQTIGGAKTFSTSVLAPIHSSSTANPATAGIFRMANTELVEWRNAANSGNVTMGVDASNIMQFSGAATFGGAITGNLTGNVTGALTGNASTATALAANPTNCSAGQYGLGIDASGNMESCGAITVLGTIGTGVWQGTTVATGFGGTGVASVTTAPTASSFAGWDASSNLSANSLINGYATTATASGTTTLTVTSKQTQYFTGSLAQTLVLPVTSTLALGQTFRIVNDNSSGTGAVAVQSSGANLILNINAKGMALCTVILTSGTTASSWSCNYLPSMVSANTASTGVFRDSSGNFTAGTVTAALTGTASGNTTYTANNHGVVISGSGNTMTVIAPTASTTKVLTNTGGASGDPTWAEPAAGGGTPVINGNINCGLAVSVGSSNLTVALKQADGSTDPASGSGACIIGFGDATVANGDFTQVSTTGALSLTVSSGTTLGCQSAVDCYLWVYAINNAGTVALGLVNGSGLDPADLQTSATPGALFGTLYSASALSTKRVALLGRIKIQEATAGTWASGATATSIAPFKNIKWSGSAYVSGCNPNLSTGGAISSFTSINNASCVLNNIAQVNSQLLWETCSSTNPPTGSGSCGAGTPEIGISWIQPVPGVVRVCMSGAIGGNVNSSSNMQDTFELELTPINAQTITQHGGTTAYYDNRVATTTSGIGVTICSLFNITTTGRQAVRLMYQYSFGGTVTQNQWYGNNGAQQTGWNIEPIDGSQ